jgi:transposase
LRQLTETEREELTRWSRSRTLAARDVFVASLILALADGTSYTQIEKGLNTSRPTIARWKARFEQDGMAGLETQHQGSKPRTITPAVQAKYSAKPRNRRWMAVPTWSCRKLAATLGLASRQCSGSGARRG